MEKLQHVRLLVLIDANETRACYVETMHGARRRLDNKPCFMVIADGREQKEEEADDEHRGAQLWSLMRLCRERK